MYQHPVPQNVTSYQFRLVGNMTLKQFFELAGGIIIALLLYYTNLPTILKWPLLILSVAGGVGIAFVPFEERPLDQWLRAYLKAIYQPTQFVWRKHSHLPPYFNFHSKDTNLQQSLEKRTLNLNTKQQGLNTFIKTLPHQQTSQDLIDAETQHLNQLNQYFSTQDPTNSTISSSTSSAPIHHTSVTSTNQIIPPHPVQANTSLNLPFPSTPSIPNTLVGMVLDSSNNIINDAVIEIFNEKQEPVRATKSNKLGQFFSAIPLKNGSYTISIQKPNFKFDTISINLNNEVIAPIIIKAQ